MTTVAQIRTNTLSPELFAEAYTNGFRHTVRFLLSKGANADIAEELAQSAWVRGWEARSQLLIADRIVPWVNSIAYHRFCNHQRRARHLQLPDVSDPRAPCASASIDAGILLDLCPPADRGLLVERYVDGMELREIAATHGLSEIAVRVRIHRCKRRIRSRVTDTASPMPCDFAPQQDLRFRSVEQPYAA